MSAQLNDEGRLNFEMSGDEVVISGISGIFPNSDSVSGFMHNLYNKVDMVTNKTPKWVLNDPDLPKHMGTIRGMNKFDAQYFGVTYQLARVLEPMGKKLLEHAYGAIIDSGTNPQTVRGKRVGVFVGSSFADTSALLMFDISKRSDFIVNGSSKAMLSNRISYWIDGKGPSITVDCSCTSSSACLEMAYRSIKNGECDSALVGGANFGIHPNLVRNMRRAGLLCLDGKTKCFDKNGDGYVRADAVNVIFLQKAKDAHRIYAEVYHAKGNYKMRPDAHFLPLRQADDIKHFLKNVYSEADMDPKTVEYVEAHGAAIAKADENEIRAISEIFGSVKPIKVGSVKSNMGNSDSASGVCAVTKLCLAYHTGILPGNLHYNDPLDIQAIQEGNVHVVTENISFGRGYAVVNNFSYTGANYHIILKGHHKEKDLRKYCSNIPHIVLASGRQEISVEKLFGLLKDHPVDAEEIGLLHKTFEYDIPGHTGRGYAILASNDDNKADSLSQSVTYYTGGKRPLWFVYSGMGSQWAGMGTDLMKIPSFAASIHNCHRVLEPKGLDLIKIVTEPDPSIFDNIIHAFVGIGAIQIGLTDLMREMGIVPDNIIGHSLGEMACAYQDGTFTVEELILSTYCRGKVCLETPLIKGSMAAVGLGYQAVMNHCPPDIDIACHNSSESCTMSGPADSMKLFLEELSKKGVFAKEVSSANMAYHSRYVADVGPKLVKVLRELIKNPKRRSSKWISTSAPENKWNESEALYSSAEYHTNNLLKPVLFEEMSKLIPDNAIVVEIAPHGLLQAILKRSHQNCTHIPLTRRGNKDGVKFFLEAIGKLYETGINPKVDVLYPKIELPVSTGTPLLSHLVDWEHSEDWPMLSYLKNDEVHTASSRNVVISVHDDDYNFLKGHIRNGINVLPESAILVLVWETLAMHMGANYKKQSVIFRDIHFHCEANILPENPLRLLISISRGNNKFEVSNEGRCIVSGIVSGVKKLKFHHKIEEKIEMDNNSFEEEIVLSSNDIYRLMHMRGYSYKHEFKSIHSTNLERNQAYVRFISNWVTFLDSLIQLYNLSRDVEGIPYPKFIQKLRISIPEQEIARTADIDGVECYNAQYIATYRVIRCAGVEIENVIFVDKPIVEQEPDVLKTKAFFPHYTMDNVNVKTALEINLQVIEENTLKPGMIIACYSNIVNKELSTWIPYLNIDIDILEMSGILEPLIENDNPNKVKVLIVENVLGDEKKLKVLHNLPKDYFIMVLENSVTNFQSYIKEKFTIITSMSDGKLILTLMKKKFFEKSTFISAPFDKLTWITKVNEELKKSKRVVLISERQRYCGAIGCVSKLKMEGKKNISLIATEDFTAPLFDPEAHIYKEQLEKNLTVNVLKKGQWGGYYYVQSTKTSKLRNFTAITTWSGDIDGLKWVESIPISARKNVIQVSYAGLSLRDVKKATGFLIEKHDNFGMDFSGIDKNGDRVMGLVGHGALSATVEADPYLLWPVPDHWSLQDAATVPLAYSLAFYCLVIRGQILRRQNILVTGGAGALGQAVISICLSLDCTVFTTVSSRIKKSFLKKLFPKLDDNNIGYSRDWSFADTVRSRVKERGCDFVINCSTGDIRLAAMKCVGTTGLFLDVTDYDMQENNDIGIHFFSNERSYRGVDFSSIFKYKNDCHKKLLRRIISDGIASGFVRPISRVEFGPENITRAFRFLSANNNIGKVLLKLRSPEILRQGLKIKPRISLDTKGTYIVVSDKNGLGTELANWLVKQGAKNIVLHSKSKISGYLQTKFLVWSKYDALIRVSVESIDAERGCTKFIKEASKLGPVKGVFVINYSDETNANDDYLLKIRENAMAVINLDLVTKKYCKDLSYFVMLTTPSKNPLDAYSVSLFEKIVDERTRTGYPALILHTQGIKEFEYLYDESNINAKFPLQTLSAIFSAMERSLKLKYKNVLTFNLLPADSDSYVNNLEKILNPFDKESEKFCTIIEELKINEIKLNEIRNLLAKYHQVDYPLEKIQSMTIGSLKNFNNLKSFVRKTSGLNVFYSTLNAEEYEIINSHPIKPMVTLLNNIADTDINPNDIYLTMIPGFEGCCNIFETAAERLKILALGVQLGPDMVGNSIPEIAKNVRKFMKTKLHTKSTFYLLGYSFGVNIALELAALLELEGHIGVVFCLDSSPDALKLQIGAYAGNLEQSKLQTAVAIHMCQLMSGRENPALKIELEMAGNWNNKLDICMRELIDIGKYTNQYKKSVINAAYKKIAIAQDYKPDLKLKSDVILIRSANVFNILDVTDYDMQENNDIGIHFFSNERSYRGVDFSSIFKYKNDCHKKLLRRIISDGIASGFVRPISRVEFGPENITRAFRFLSANNNIGKVLLKLRSPEILRQGLKIKPRISLDTKGTYIVVSDKNGLGTELANWLVKQGAKNIVLHSKSKISGYLQTKFLVWSKYDALIRVSVESIDAERGCTKFIKEASKLGPVKGVFVINYSDETNANDDYLLKIRENAMAVINLDLVTKKYCKDLSYFVMLTTPSKNPLDAYSVSLFEKIVDERTRTGYPALILHTQGIKEFEYLYDESNINAKFPLQTLSAIFSAMERSLKLKYKNVLTFNLLPADSDSYVNNLEKILNPFDKESEKFCTIIEELKINEIKLNEIRNLLAKYHQVDYPLEKIQSMTIGSLKNFNNLKSFVRKTSGLNVFYSTLNAEEYEIINSHPIKPMVTLLNNIADTDINPNDIYLTMIPGFEGCCNIFETAAERLKILALGVQLGPDMVGNSIPEIAKNVRKFMKTKLHTKSTFYLLGYSFGVNIALELAALLELEGHIGVVFCLDSSPDALKLQIGAYAGNLEQSKLQTAVAIHMCQLMSGRENPALKIELEMAGNWNNKLDICMRELIDIGKYTNQYKKSVINAAYKKIAIAQDYKPDLKLKSDVILIRSANVFNSLPEDYNLSKFTEKPVKIFPLHTDHASIIYNCKVTNIVNSMLDHALLEDMKKMNLCEKYVIKVNVC